MSKWNLSNIIVLNNSTRVTYLAISNQAAMKMEGHKFHEVGFLGTY